MYSFKEFLNFSKAFSFKKKQNTFYVTGDKIIAICSLDDDINLRDEYVVTSISSCSLFEDKTIEFTKIKKAKF